MPSLSALHVGYRWDTCVTCSARRGESSLNKPNHNNNETQKVLRAWRTCAVRALKSVHIDVQVPALRSGNA